MPNVHSSVNTTVTTTPSSTRFGKQPASGRIWWGVSIAGVLVLAGWLADTPPLQGADEDQASPSANSKETVKEALSELNDLIGEWRGVGLPKRNSQADAWTETAEWKWTFSDDKIALRYDIEDGRLFEWAELTYAPQSETYQLQAHVGEDISRHYTGRFRGKKLILESQPDADEWVHRLTITRLNAKRTLVLHERRRESTGFYRRVAEVGYTREGTSLAVAGAGERECIVSGGAGTIRVTYQGETFYVCCTGCQQAFEESPEEIIAEYRQKLADEKADK